MSRFLDPMWRGPAALVVDCALDKVEERRSAAPLTFSAGAVLPLLEILAATLGRDYNMSTGDVLRQLQREVETR